jgi:hypothetical protein
MGLIDKLQNEGSLFQGAAGLGGIQPQSGATGRSKLHDKYSLDGTDSSDVITQLGEYDTRTSTLAPQPSNLDTNGENPTGPLRNPGTVAINNTFINGTYRDSAPPGSTSF